MTEAEKSALASPDCLVRIRRPDGRETLLRVPAEHWERVIALADGEFGDQSIMRDAKCESAP